MPLLLFQCLTSKQAFTYNPNSTGPQNAKPGACYAKCYMPNQSATNSNYFAVYTGDEATEDVDIETKEIMIKPASTKWEKKKSDRKCLSADPNDCLVWCLVDIPAESISYKILKDTSQSMNYEMTEIKQEVLTKKGGYTEWKEVLCENQLDESIYQQIKLGLINNNFLEAEVANELPAGFGTQMKSSLTKFQRANGLPVGRLDLETLDTLGVEY